MARWTDGVGMTHEILTGSCFCGAIRYRAEAPKTLHYLCHCTHCQRYSGSAHHAAIVVAANDLKVEGTPKVYTTKADSGRDIARHFCGDCGGHLFTSPWPEATRFSIKAGTLDDRSLFKPTDQIWDQSRPDWVDQERAAHAQGFPVPVNIGAAADPDQDKF